MSFQIPPEPTYKEDWKKRLQGSPSESRLTRANIKQGTWLTTDLWNNYGWKEELKKRGITWQGFMALYRDCYHNFISWAQGTLSWQQAVDTLKREIERHTTVQKP